MIVLGFDTATPATAVALRLGDGRTLEARDDPAPGAHPGHATRLLEMARELLAEVPLAWGQLERIAVGVGPGTFTGLRVGVATARGLAQALSADVVGVSSLQALAAGAFARSASDTVLAVIDARRGEAFAAAYERDGDGGAPRQLTPPRALAPELLGEVVATAQRPAGQPGRSWLALGDGARRYGEQLRAAGVPVAEDSSSLHLVSAAAICELGAGSRGAVASEPVLPDYRRRPDAELALREAGTVPVGGR